MSTAPVRVAVAVACLGLATAAVAGRAGIVALAPGAASLYAGVGLPVRSAGLQFHAVAAEMVGSGAETALVVEGEIANISTDGRPVPPIEISIRNPAGQPFYTWTTEPVRPTLAARETTRFRARLAAPPPEGTQVLVRFASAAARGSP